MTKDELAAAIGRRVARAVFDRRSRDKAHRNVEVHVREDELAAYVAVGAAEALKRKNETEGQS